MQSYHAALLSVCKACIPSATSSTTARLDRSYRLVNAQRRILRLGGPQVNSTNCLDTLLEHVRYLLSCQQDSTESQETAWISDAIVGQYLNDLGSAWVTLVQFAELSCSRLMQNVESSGILQLVARAADIVTAEATAATPQTLQTSSTTIGIGIAMLWSALNDTFKTSLDKMLVGSSGQPLLSILRMIFKLMTLVSHHQAKQPAGTVQLTTLAFKQAVQRAYSFAIREISDTAAGASAEQRALCSDSVFLQAIALAPVLTVMQLRSFLQAIAAALTASSSTAISAPVPTHHVELLRALHLENAAAVLATPMHNEQAYTTSTHLIMRADMRAEWSAVGTAYELALSMLCIGGGGNSSCSQLQCNGTEQPAANLDLQQSSDQQARQKGANQQQPRHQPQQEEDLLHWLPELIGVLRELQLLAQQLQPIVKHVCLSLPSNDKGLDDIQQSAVAAMVSICCGLVDAVLSQPEQQQQLELRLTVLDNCCGHLEAALRGYGFVAKAGANDIVGQLNKLLLWLISSPAAGQLTSSAFSNITVPGVCGLLLTYFKCLAVEVQTLNSKDSSRTHSELINNRVKAGTRRMLETASTGVRLAGMAMTTAAANTAVSGTLPDAAAAGLMLAGRSMYMAGDITIKGKVSMLPDLHTPEGVPVYLSLPWGPSGFNTILEGLDMLLPQLKLPGASVAAQAAAAELQEQYQQFKQTLLQWRTTFRTGEVILRRISDVDAGVPEQLLSFGAALCTQLPMPWCCNNFNCLNLSCESEQKLVEKKCTCPGCRPRRARYCGRECQKQHWDQHRPVCKRLSSS